MEKTFHRMNGNNALVEKLENSDWWRKIVSDLNKDKDINIQVRGDYLNIYYKMSNLLKVKLGKNKKDVACHIHNKFNPFARLRRRNKKDGYVKMAVRDGFLNGPKVRGYGYSIDIFEGNNFRTLKRCILPHVGEEKKWQSRLIYDNKKTILDAEIAFNDIEQDQISSEVGTEKKRRTRIDLLNFDRRTNKMIAIELKMASNKELYNGSIQKQLERYTAFLTDNEPYIKKAYEDAKHAKRALGLPEDGLAEVDFNKVEIEKKPLLVVVCGNQSKIDQCKEKILKAVEKNALGVFFFGKSGNLNIPAKKWKNKFVPCRS